ncbi:MAG: AMP-binding protein, partial [Sphingomonas sp.]|nr:AMP-binding protein [Sphingomonas sp.]
MSQIRYKRDVGGWSTRWSDSMADAATASGEWPNRTVADYARERSEQEPDRVLISDGSCDMSSRQLYTQAQHIAGWLVELGLEPGHVISFQLPNWWETAVINIAAAMIGVVVNPIVPMNRDAEVQYMLETSKSSVIFVPGLFRKFDHAAMIERLLPNIGHQPVVVTVRDGDDRFTPFASILAESAPLERPRAVDPNAVKLLMYTSGTTGRPKGVLHSHNTINADSVKMTAAMSLGRDDATFCPSPVTHVSGYLWALNAPFYANLPVVMIDVWDPDRASDLIK